MADTGDGHWLTYRELGELLRIKPDAARQHAKRRGWPRRTPNAYGDFARVLVPDGLSVQPRPALFAEHPGDVTDPVDGHDRGTITALHQAIEALSVALAAERERVIRTEAALADATGAARIAAGEAAGLRAELDRLRSRPWWRRWWR